MTQLYPETDMHICADEVLMFLASIPFIGMAVTKVKVRIHAFLHRRKCPHGDAQ